MITSKIIGVHRTMSAPQRRILPATAALTGVLLLTALAGCASSPATTSAPATPVPPSTASTASASAAPTAAVDPAAFETLSALVKAPGKPYAATMKAETTIGGESTVMMTGRLNINGPATGRLHIETADDGAGRTLSMDSVVVADAMYGKGVPGTTGWVKLPRSAEAPVADYAGYAKLIAAGGPASLKGVEQQAGGPVYHLSGPLTTEQITTIDARTAKSMGTKGMTSFQCDLWLDGESRAVRFEQRGELRGVAFVNSAVFSEFGPTETVSAPTD
ncbi:hypothetical protein OG871_03400 [Kitasatospora sp. NBC_00374]|uniref:hypothetical protein n=1 Tax=Kitasatospora sp. NBC_00374 TaxID=2975964 RepID=UPI0030DDFBC0